MDVTYRVVNLLDRDEVGQTAATPEIARLTAAGLNRVCRLGLERTDWTEHFGKLKVHRSVVVEVENQPGEWDLGL
jgi:hypothetical protein